MGGVIILSGCFQSDFHEDKDYLICVGKTFITQSDFNKAFEISKAAYDYDVITNPSILKKLRFQFLKQISQQLILLERARELNIIISDLELNTEIKKFKQGYSEKEFQKTLLEAAISYETWKKELKTRLIMEKVVDKDLASKISIDLKEIEKYRVQYLKGKILRNKEELAKVDKIIIKNIRREKAQSAYQSWIEKLETQYQVKINQAAWEGLVAKSEQNF